MTLEAVKLAQAGFGDFVPDTGVSRLKGKACVSEEVYIGDTIGDTISNSHHYHHKHQ